MRLTHLLRGKSQEEIINAFRNKYNIDTYDWKEFVEKLKMTKTKKHLQLFWTIPLMLIGMAMLFASFGFLFDDQFPTIYKIAENVQPTFFQRFVNIFYAMILFIIPSGIIAIPIIKWNQVYGV